MKLDTHRWRTHVTALLAACLHLDACATPRPASGMSDGDVEDLVRRTWPYVAMYNVDNGGAWRSLERRPWRAG